MAAMPDRPVVPGADSCAIAAGDALPFDRFDTDTDRSGTPDEFTHLCIIVDDAIDT